MQEGNLLLFIIIIIIQCIMHTCNVNYGDCSIRVYRYFGIIHIYIKIPNQTLPLMLALLLATYYAGISRRGRSLDWQHRK